MKLAGHRRLRQLRLAAGLHEVERAGRRGVRALEVLRGYR